jgi:hypothetical protein
MKEITVDAVIEVIKTSKYRPTTTSIATSLGYPRTNAYRVDNKLAYRAANKIRNICKKHANIENVSWRDNSASWAFVTDHTIARQKQHEVAKANRKARTKKACAILGIDGHYSNQHRVTVSPKDLVALAKWVSKTLDK